MGSEEFSGAIVLVFCNELDLAIFEELEESVSVVLKLLIIISIKTNFLLLNFSNARFSSFDRLGNHFIKLTLEDLGIVDKNRVFWSESIIQLAQGFSQKNFLLKFLSFS
jgi:hypothetical protein